MKSLLRLVQTALAAGFVFVLPLLFGFSILSGGPSNEVVAQTRPLYEDAILATSERTADTQVFNEPVVSVVFDDGWESIYRNAFPIMEEFGIDSSQFIIAGSFDDEQYMSVEQMLHMMARGHEIGSHTMTHSDLTQLNADALTFELRQSQTMLEQYTDTEINDFVAPLGAFNQDTVSAVKTLYRSHRTTLKGINTADNYDPYRLLSPTIIATDTAEFIADMVAEAKASNGWLILTYHQIDASDSKYAVTPENFRAHMQALVDANVDIVPYGRVIDLIEEQRHE